MRAFLILSSVFLFISCGNAGAKQADKKLTGQTAQKSKDMTAKNLETATLGGGCFWCMEAIFQRLEGVEKVESGFSGGKIKNPAYREVCSGLTGHAEVIQVTFDTSKIAFLEILKVFFETHDPTTLNRQGNDVGTQYRSVIFYHDDKQKQVAEDIIKELNSEKIYDNPVVTEVAPFTAFYKAEDYHQNYYNENGSQPYCQYVIQPKVEKFEKLFKDKLKH